MRGRLVDLSFSLNGKQRLTIELDDDFRKSYAELHDSDVRIKITKYRKRRSLDANAYCWVLIDKIAQATGVDKTTVYREAIKEIGGVSDIVCVQNDAVDKLREGWQAHGLGWQTDVMPSKIEGCTNVVLYYGSSTYDTKQMSALIDSLVQEAQALGIETLPPAEIARLNSQWEERQDG
jgi:hypothetical protein